METISECPICGNQYFDDYLVSKDYLVSGEEFTIQECRECKFKLTNPRPSIDSIGRYYKSADYISHNDNSTGFISTVYRLVRNYTLQSKVKLIEKLNKGTGRILDVGCGTGAFLENCQNNGWTVAGIEPDKDVRAITQHKLQTTILADLNCLNMDEQFNIITLWHVLEHIPNLNEVIEKLSHMLAPEGTLLIAVPNSESYDAHYFGKYWAAYDVPRHLYHFTPSTVENLFKKFGLRLQDKKPMLFDAFYIAMLSSRYKTGKTNYLESIQVGIISNIKATKTGSSSSVVYILKS